MKNDIPPAPGSGNGPLKEEALPGYQAVDDAPPDIVASFANLNLGRKERKPTPDECIAHLKLLEAISQLRDDVGMTDGLYGLFDRIADDVPEGDKRTELLSKIREKRWASMSRSPHVASKPGSKRSNHTRHRHVHAGPDGERAVPSSARSVQGVGVYKRQPASSW